jgi:hypothetical protein
MSVSHLRVVPRAHAPHRARVSALAKALKRFRPEIRDGVAQLARRHVRLAELAQSFPALLAALAWPRAGFDARPAIRGVIAGEPLAMLAEQAGVPLWLRKMPAEMLIAPLPALPDGAFVRHRIVNHVPKNPKLAQVWFESVAFAARWAHEDFALWVAQAIARKELQRRRRERNWRFYSLPRLCLWAWYSGQPGSGAHALIATPWKPEMQLRAAFAAAEAWHAELTFPLSLGRIAVDDVWLAPAAIDGHDFVPLRSAADLAEEAVAMQNCVRTYGAAVTQGEDRLWSVRKEGVRVATLEVVRYTDAPLPRIREMRLAKNQAPPPELWVVAGKWLQMQALTVEAMVVPPPDGRMNLAAWRAMWKPYWLAKRGAPRWLPITPPRYALDDL